MCAGFSDHAIFENYDVIGVLYGRYPVTHDHDGALAKLTAEMPEYGAFGIDIDSGKRVVKNENFRTSNERPSNGRTLFLPPGQRDSSFTNERLEAFRECSHVFE